jgi:hypothetical protein
MRLGADVEGVMSISDGALRIDTLATPGWGRAGVAYGPMRREAGLSMSALVLNGLNASAPYNLSMMHRRVARWVLGVPGVDPPWARLWRWPGRMTRDGALRRLECWWKSRGRAVDESGPERDNLAVGWFPTEAPGDAPRAGNAIVMRGAGHENGEIGAVVAGRTMPVARGVQNLPIVYMVALREQGAAYYAATLPEGPVLGSYPQVRPIGIDPFGADATVYAGVQQRVLGEIGFSACTAVQSVRAAVVEGWREWYGSAHAADTMAGTGPLEGSAASRGMGVGGCWRALAGSMQRTGDGARAIAAGSVCVVEAPGASGLVHVLIQSGSGAPPRAGIVWRARDASHCWAAVVGGDGWEVRMRDGGAWEVLATGTGPVLRAGALSSLQVLDDGRMVGVYLDGEPLLPAGLADERLAGERAVGVIAQAADGGIRFREFEAHARGVPIPVALDPGPMWCERGDRIVVSDDFGNGAGDRDGGGGPDLAGRMTPVGAREWQRDIGRGVIDLAGDGAAAGGRAGGGGGRGGRVRASVAAPNPGRTVYTVPWEYPEFAEVEAVITPPGTGRGQRENGRGGVVLWQDRRNYVLVNLWLFDDFPGASISSFFHLNGHEDLFDAVWTNVGAMITWGRPYRLSVAFDGLRYLARVDGTPVLYRSLRDVYPGAARLAINRVGVCVNWEFQDDTGSVFHRFAARARTGEARP